MMSLNPFENKVLVSANCLTCSRTTSIPRSSDAFNWCEISKDQKSGRLYSYLKNLFMIVAAVYSSGYCQNSRGLSSTRGTVEQKVGKPVLYNEFFNFGPVNEWPSWSNRIHVLVVIMSLWETTSSKEKGLYFSTLYK